MKLAHGLSLSFVGTLLGLLACDRVVELPIEGCTSGTQDGTETDVDCGGTCAAKCADAKGCKTGTDCVSLVCAQGVCQAATCSDTVKNAEESGVDCGGPTCPKCADGKTCRSGADCVSAVCISGVCAPATCTDKVKNATESDVDCGGACVPAARCDDGKTCNVAADCKSGVCKGGTCQIASCSDTVKNGAEGDVDCGTPCSVKCNDGQTCNVGGDCKSGVCEAGLCKKATCTDGVKNGSEGDVDCGAACPNFCDDGKTCANGDCKSGVCTNGVCTPSACTDKTQNGGESDVDCGTVCPTKCDDLKKCTLPGDCKSLVCTGNICQVPTCTDNQKNGAESDKDCGAACPNKCADTKACFGPTDCQSGVCTGNVCQAPTCGDGVQNGGETDIDCGGAGSCPRCVAPSKCGNDADCVTALCVANKCAACSQPSDCGSSRDCVAGACVAPLGSCKLIKDAAAASTDGTHRIDPDGAGGLAPFLVHCDMTTAGGGWTALPLDFTDTNFWDVTVSGTNCVTVTKGPAAGVLRSEYTSLVGSGHAYTNVRFKPTIAVSSVSFRSFLHRTGGTCNTMDLATKGTNAPTATDEGWWVSNGTIPAAGAQPAIAGILFPDCSQPGYVDHTAYCNMGNADINAGNATFNFGVTANLTATAPQFHMVLDEGCNSAVCATGTGELFECNVAPDGDGVWRKGIFVR